MPDSENKSSIFGELKRRNVFRVAIAYVLVAWFLLQIADVLFPALTLPDWTIRLVAGLLILGFPLAIFFAWVFELTPEGLKRENQVDRSESITHATGRKLNLVITGILTIAVVLLVRQSWFTNTTESSTFPILDKSIAVLTFDNRSASEENAEFFAAGVHDDLLTLLSGIGDLRVISRTSVERLDPNLTVPQIGELLKVSTVLEGQVQRADDRLRINAQLIDAATEEHLWAKTYDRELTATNVFDVQSEIAKIIAEALHAQLTPDDESRLAKIPTENTAALNLYLLGRQLVKRSTVESLRQAERRFREATELDPTYAESWVAIADVNSQLLFIGAISNEQYAVAAEPAIGRALALDNQLAEAHAQLATLGSNTGDFDAADASFQRALELNPSDSRSLLKYGQYTLRVKVLMDESISLYERALESDPLSVEILFNIGQSQTLAGRPDRSIEYNERILEIDPASAFGYVGLWEAYLFKGRYDLMLPWLLKSLAIDPNEFEIWAAMALAFHDVGAPEWADRYLRRALALAPNGPRPLRYKAILLELRGSDDEALDMAHRALEEGIGDRNYSNPVFMRLIRDSALQSGNYESAMRWYRTRHPELFSDIPDIGVNNYAAAVDLALLLQHAGDPNKAKSILQSGLAWHQATHIPKSYGYVTGITRVQFLAVSGEKEAALEALREALDSGWRFRWRWQTQNENLASIRDDPEFRAIIDEFDTDMATQLAAIRALPYQGETDLRFVDGTN